MSLALVGVMAAGAACTGSAPPAGPAPPASPAPPPAAEGLTWQRLAPAPSQRTEVAATAVGERIYVLGGFHGDGSTVASVEVFDAAAGRWGSAPDLPIDPRRAAPGAAGGLRHAAPVAHRAARAPACRPPYGNRFAAGLNPDRTRTATDPRDCR